MTYTLRPFDGRCSRIRQNLDHGLAAKVFCWMADESAPRYVNPDCPAECSTQHEWPYWSECAQHRDGYNPQCPETMPRTTATHYYDSEDDSEDGYTPHGRPEWESVCPLCHTRNLHVHALTEAFLCDCRAMAHHQVGQPVLFANDEPVKKFLARMTFNQERMAA